MPYLLLNGDNAPAPKGYTCPLGQVCKVRPSFESRKRMPWRIAIIYQEDQNPESGVQGFDTIYMAALQVLIVASANGVWLASFVPLVSPLILCIVVASDVRHG